MRASHKSPRSRPEVEEVGKRANLPAGLPRKPSNLHTEGSAPWTWVGTLGHRIVTLTRATRKLDSEALIIQGRPISRADLVSASVVALMLWLNDLRKAVRIIGSVEIHKVGRDLDDWGNSPGTTSLASMASSYSMKPKPFMSLISLMVPAPSLKWF